MCFICKVDSFRQKEGSCFGGWNLVGPRILGAFCLVDGSPSRQTPRAIWASRIQLLLPLLFPRTVPDTTIPGIHGTFDSKDHKGDWWPPPLMPVTQQPDRAPSDVRFTPPGTGCSLPPRSSLHPGSRDGRMPPLLLISTMWNMVSCGVGNFLPYSASGMYPHRLLLSMLSARLEWAERATWRRWPTSILYYLCLW